jgi:hypothetical protein
VLPVYQLVPQPVIGQQEEVVMRHPERGLVRRACHAPRSSADSRPYAPITPAPDLQKSGADARGQTERREFCVNSRKPQYESSAMPRKCIDSGDGDRKMSLSSRFSTRVMKLRAAAIVTAVAAASAAVSGQSASRPFGTLREQAMTQQEWLRKRLDAFLPVLMRKHGIDMWVVPTREYNEDPIFSAITAPETFAARRRTIYVFFDTCAAAGTAPSPACVQRIALGGTSQGGMFEARRSTQKAAGQEGPGRRSPGEGGRGQQAELWGDEQWQALKAIVEERNPRVIGIQPVHRVCILRRADQRRAQRDDGGARRHVDVALPRRGRIAVGADRGPAAGRGSVLPTDAGTRVVDDAGDVLVENHHAG